MTEPEKLREVEELLRARPYDTGEPVEHYIKDVMDVRGLAREDAIDELLESLRARIYR